MRASSARRLLKGIAAATLLVVAFATTSEAQIYYPPYRYGRYLPPDASVRFDVKPKEAAIYIDGYYAGIVDDFSGVFQRLHTAPGGHELTLFLEGYRTYSQKAYLSPDNTFKMRYRMEKLPGGEASERPPAPAVPPPPEVQPGQPNPPPVQGGPPPRGPFGRRGPRPPDTPPNAAPAPPGQPPAEGSRGTLALTLRPADADVFIDGEPWRGPTGERITIELPEGRHNLQVRKPGYVGYLTDVQIRGGETTPLDVNLRTQP